MRLIRFKLLIAFLILLGGRSAFAVQSVVILPFANQSDKQEIYWLGEGFAESLSEELMFQEAYIIQRPERKAAYEDLHLPYIGDLSRATMLKIGEKLSSDFVVFGSYNLKETQLSVGVKVIQISSTRLSDPIAASAPLNQLYQVQTAIRDGLKKYFVSQNLMPMEQQPLESQTVPLHAYELYIKGLLEVSDNERIRFFQRAIDANPGYSQALYRLGLALSKLQRYKESTDFLKRVSLNGAFRPKTDFQIGLNAYNSRDFDGAYQKWLDLSKTNPSAEVFNNIGIALMKKNDFQNPEWYLTQAIKLDPENENLHFNLAALYLQRKMDPNAADQYREVIRIHPNDFQALYFLCKLMERMGTSSSNKILEYFQEALPTDQKGKFPEQYTSFVQLLRVSPAFSMKEEKEYFNRAKENSANDRADFVHTYRTNATKYLEREDPGKAILEIRKGVGLAPLDWQLHYLWGAALVQQDNSTGAVPELQFSLWCKENVESHVLLAEIFRDADRYADAKLQIQQCLALDPKNKRALEIWNKIWDKK